MPVIIGADWDRPYADEVAEELVNLGKVPTKVWLNLIGRTPVALAMAYMKIAKVTVGIANGLPMLAAYLNKPSVILWPQKDISSTRVQWGKIFQTSWVPPSILERKLYKAVVVGDVTVDKLFNAIRTLAEMENHAITA